MKVLIVVDMQNDFIDGSLGTKEAQSIVPKVKEKIEEYRNHEYPIFFTRDTHYEDYLKTQEGKNLPVEHCIFGTYGWQIKDGLDHPNGDCCDYIDKETFGWHDWKTVLFDFYGIFDEIELVGLCTDICVISNALILKATFPETKITVDASCCAGVTPQSHKNALEAMKMCQVNVINEEKSI